MEDPAKEIPAVIEALCHGSVQEQRDAMETYFLPRAAFQHPLCRVPSMQGKNHKFPVIGEVNSRLIIMAIYRWYRLLSPKIEFTIHSISFDEDAEILYINMSQIFAIWFIPFYRAHVRLVAVMTLTTEAPPMSYRQPGLQYSDVTAGRKPRYHVLKQEDHYQVNDLASFFLPGLGPFLCKLGQFVGTVGCLIGAFFFGILSRVFCGGEKAVRLPIAAGPSSATEK